MQEEGAWFILGNAVVQLILLYQLTRPDLLMILAPTLGTWLAIRQLSKSRDTKNPEK
jgi:hypothetical protein